MHNVTILELLIVFTVFGLVMFGMGYQERVKDEKKTRKVEKTKIK